MKKILNIIKNWALKEIKFEETVANPTAFSWLGINNREACYGISKRILENNDIRLNGQELLLEALMLLLLYRSHVREIENPSIRTLIDILDKMLVYTSFLCNTQPRHESYICYLFNRATEAAQKNPEMDLKGQMLVNEATRTYEMFQNLYTCEKHRTNESKIVAVYECRRALIEFEKCEFNIFAYRTLKRNPILDWEVWI